MATRTAPFSGFEFLIAWRYLRARRAEGGVSVMTWISLIGIMLGVAALIITLAVRAGFRAEFVDTILGSNAHVTVYSAPQEVVAGTGIFSSLMPDYQDRAERIRKVPGVTRAAPLIRGQAMATFDERSNVADVYGISAEDLATIPRVANPKTSRGDLARFGEGIAMGSELARELGVTLGDRVRLISPNGAKTAFGTSPRVNAYEVVYIFTAGRWDIDRTRVYMPFAEAQSYFNREAGADEIEVDVTDPERVDDWTPQLIAAGGAGTMLWSWRDASGSFLRALDIEDNVMFVILAVLVLIATMNITSGLIMLVKNKGRDIGILRTMGLTEGSVLRVFFLCGAFTGVIGTAAGVALGVVFALYIDQVMAFVNWLNGGGAWDPSIRGIYALPAKLQPWDVSKAVALSLGLSFVVTIFPARRAARLNPVEALRYE
ncbi:lipoprotein-releasing system permease protein [Rhodobacter sp. 140A]|uniref:Lipoprotein-releasing system transmembrane protein LolC n=1 Tax=bioreactor metagenome TaxID=1076179 RepID=A0A644VPP0_9ZZZZ|nr:lipoprotein-releasing system permease protein [Rhodobacter sp. 140A]